RSGSPPRPAPAARTRWRSARSGSAPGRSRAAGTRRSSRPVDRPQAPDQRSGRRSWRARPVAAEPLQRLPVEIRVPVLRPVNERLDAPLDVRPRQHHPVAAGRAPQADVRADPHYRPVRAATGVGPPQANHVSNTKLDPHTPATNDATRA